MSNTFNQKEYNKKWFKENQHKIKEYISNNIPAYLLRVAKSRAKKRNIEFSISIADINVPEFCPILGIKLEYNMNCGKGGKPSSYSLDRIDNTKGYVKDNVQVISHLANSMKSTATPEQLKLFSNWIEKVYI